MSLNRREFLLGSLAAAAAACAKPLVAQPTSKASLRFGYSASTWGARDLLAMQQISELGYAGVQLRANVVNAFVRNPPTLTNLLADKHLTFVALSSGPLSVEPPDEARMLGEHAGRAKFVHDVGGLFLQVTDERPRNRDVTEADIDKLASLLNELGTRTSEVGVKLAYHPQMGTIGEAPAATDRIMAKTDPGKVRLLLDVAQYKQGGGDPAAAIRKHRDRLALLHLSDVEPITTDPGYRFVELGRGTVNYDAVFAALDNIAFSGWAVVELDSTTAPDRTAMQSAEINKAFLEARGFRLSA